jgi:hypothetical protein
MVAQAGSTLGKAMVRILGPEIAIPATIIDYFCDPPKLPDSFNMNRPRQGT